MIETPACDTGARTGPRQALRLAVVGFGAALAVCGCRSAKAPANSAGSNGNPAASAQLVEYNGQSAIRLDPASLNLAGITTVSARTTRLRAALASTGQVNTTYNGSVQVTARLPGRIVQTLVSVGSHVHAGQLIALVDSVDLTQAEATYRTALAHATLTRHQLDQQRKLAALGTISEQPVEDARRAYAAAQAAVAGDQAQLALDRQTMSSTQQLVKLGEITRKPVEDAQNAFAQAQAARIQAEATLRSDKLTLDRTTALFNAGIYSKQQLEDAETGYRGASAAVDQTRTQEKLASQELTRQRDIYRRNLNSASALQAAQSKLLQDQHTYQNDLTTQEVTRTELARAQNVRRTGIPVSQALQQAEDAYNEAEVALRGAAATLRLYGIAPGQSVTELANGHVVVPVVAPLTGVVTQRNMVVGQMTDTSTPLAKVVNLDRVNVDAQVYEEDLPRVTVGDAARASVSAFPNRVFIGRVRYVGHEISPDTRTATVTTEIVNPGWALRPGMFASVTIAGGTATERLTIPAAAVLTEGVRQVVYLAVDPHTFARRAVRVGTAVGGRVPVYGGLAPGDRVVATGNVLLESEQDTLQTEKGTGA